MRFFILFEHVLVSSTTPQLLVKKDRASIISPIQFNICIKAPNEKAGMAIYTGIINNRGKITDA